jgi:uncharacterized protein (DUF58 family)
VAVAAILFYYAGTSEVVWLYLLSYWLGALIIGAYLYLLWNRGLRGEVYVRSYRLAPGSPMRDLPDSVLRARPHSRAFEGDGILVDLKLVSDRGTRGPVRMTGSVGGHDVETAAGLVTRQGWSDRKEVGPVRRGPLFTEGWVLETSDVLGLFREKRTKTTGQREIALVLPRFASLGNRPQVRELEATAASCRSGSGTELFGVREYRPGDPLRRIHWRSSARHGELIVREYEPPGIQSLGIFCDPAPPTAEIADQIARIAASEAWDCVRNGGRVVLWSPGAEATRPDESRSFWALLEWLARYPNPAPGDAEPPPPRVADVVAVIAGADQRVVEVVDGIKRRGGATRAWVVGSAVVDIDATVERTGVSWPL